MYKVIRYCLFLLMIGIFMSQPQNAQADVAPFGPPEGTNPVPGTEITQVRMVAETVIIDIDADTPYAEGLAHVTASFTMRNLGRKRTKP